MDRTHADEQRERMPRGPAEAGAEREDEHRRKVQIERLRAAGRNLSDQIEAQVRKRPYVVLGAATGVGLVAGSLFGRRLGQMLLAAGVGYVARNVVGGNIDIDRIQAGIERLAGEGERKA